jgi:predicted RNA polymerase sigma factor
VRVTPTIGALVGRAAAIAEARGAESAWPMLQAIPAESVVAYQPYWAVTATVLTRMWRVEEARAAYERAIGLSDDPAVREFLVGQMKPFRENASRATGI